MGKEWPFRIIALAVDETKPDPWLLAAFEDQTARLMRVSSMFEGSSDGTEMGTPLWHPKRLWLTALHPDGRLLLTSDGTARQWRRPLGQALGPPVPEPGATEGAKTWASDDGRRVLVGGRDGAYRLWDAASGHPIGEPLPITSPGDADEIPLRVVFSRDGRRMATCWVRSKPNPKPGNPTVRSILDAELRTWDSVTAEPLGPGISMGAPPFLRFSFSPDGRRLLFLTTGPGTILDATTLQPDAVLGPIPGRAQGRQLCDAHFSPDGRWLLTLWLLRLSMRSSGAFNNLNEPDAFQLWDAATGRAAGEAISSDGTITGAVFSPDGRRLATGHTIRGRTTVEFRQVTRLWDLPSCRPIGTVIDQAEPSTFSADGSALLTHYDQDIRIWEIPSCRPIGEPLQIQRTIQLPPRESTATFSPEGRLLAIGTEDHYAQLIDTQTGRPSGPRLPHPASVIALAFSSDGTLLLTGSADGVARFWSVATGRPVGPALECPGHRVERVAFAPDGRSVASWFRVSDSCRMVRHWSVPTPWAGDVAAIRRRVERMTNLQLEADDVARPLSAEKWHARLD